MIAACYISVLYCDCNECIDMNYKSAEAEFTGNTWADTAGQARKLGWRISKDKTRCFAPGHKINQEG